MTLQFTDQQVDQAIELVAEYCLFSGDGVMDYARVFEVVGLAKPSQSDAGEKAPIVSDFMESFRMRCEAQGRPPLSSLVTSRNEIERARESDRVERERQQCRQWAIYRRQRDRRRAELDGYGTGNLRSYVYSAIAVLVLLLGDQLIFRWLLGMNHLEWYLENGAFISG
jgi:hypothetical protein